MRIVRTAPCYCTECEAPDALSVRFQNKAVVQNGSFALCNKHAKQLASMLLQHTRKGWKQVKPA